MALSSPGVQVTVIDESFYTPAEPGTTPLIVVTSAENKSNGSGTGTAPGTLKANAGTVYTITSQKDLVDTFGDPVFKTDSNNNPIHAGEQNEYGLQAAYSLLGVSNRAYVVRADIDLDQLDASAEAPAGEPENGTHWFDTASTLFGIFEWNGTGATTSGGQKFSNKVPIVVTDPTKVNSLGDPVTSVGKVGDYAIVATTNENKLFYRERTGAWVQVGSEDWFLAWPTVTGAKAIAEDEELTAGHSLIINGVEVAVPSVPNNFLSNLAEAITEEGIEGISASVVGNKLEIYCNGKIGDEEVDSDSSNAVVIEAGEGNLVAGTAAASDLGIAANTYYAPRLVIAPHTSIPTFKATDLCPRPTGSIWIKTTDPNLGAKWRIKKYNSTTKLWTAVDSPLYTSNAAALKNLDSTGGGQNLAVGTLYVRPNWTEANGTDSTIRLGDSKIYRRRATGATTITSDVITSSTWLDEGEPYSFVMAETLKGQVEFDTGKVIEYVPTGSAEDDANLFAGVINDAGFTNIIAEVTAQNRVVIKHTTGGEMRLLDGQFTPLNLAGFAPYNPSNGTGTLNLYALTEDPDYDFAASLWEPLVYTASNSEPTSLAEDGLLWYNSIVDEVDLMVHDGNTWVGYRNALPDTDSNGPIVAASEPTTQSDGVTALKDSDIWIDTSDIENYPVIYKYNGTTLSWDLVNNTDQTTENGILFADARYNVSGSSSDEPGDILDMLLSDYLDPDAPDPALYPKGMLLWNLRRSGFNVKRFVRNSIDTTDENIRFGDEDMGAYYPHRWVTESGNQENGAGTFGRKAQRKVVVQAMQALVNANQDIRDEERLVFNLLSAPGYPELIGELNSLNTDRGLTAFVVGDSPARLPATGTDLNNWGTNKELAVEDNDLGLVSFDEYLGVFYPWGFTSDNFGNNVVVPPSHMILRTIALNDQVAYPWFAPAGTRRGGITNATAVGYIDAEGEFRSVALNEGVRDTMASIKVNPITFLTGSGLVNFGQYTRARNASALDRINVARLVVYLRRQLNALAKPYIFEPNDKITRDEIKGAVESLLLELVGQRALYDYVVVCDESNNTPSRIDRNELYVDIAIEPVKAVEFIYIPLRLKNTGEIASLG
jgi:hypothetical protein